MYSSKFFSVKWNEERINKSMMKYVSIPLRTVTEDEINNHYVEGQMKVLVHSKLTKRIVIFEEILWRLIFFCTILIQLYEQIAFIISHLIYWHDFIWPPLSEFGYNLELDECYILMDNKISNYLGLD